MYQQENKFRTTNLMNFIDLLEKYKIVFNKTYKLAMIAITIAVSSAACERTFTCLRILKTYLRNKMYDEHLSDLAIINIKKKITKLLDLKEVIKNIALNHHNQKIIYLEECIINNPLRFN